MSIYRILVSLALLIPSIGLADGYAWHVPQIPDPALRAEVQKRVEAREAKRAKLNQDRRDDLDDWLLDAMTEYQSRLDAPGSVETLKSLGQSLKQLMEAGADPNRWSYPSNVPIWCLLFILHSGPNIRNQEGYEEAFLDVLRIMLDYGANPMIGSDNRSVIVGEVLYPKGSREGFAPEVPLRVAIRAKDIPAPLFLEMVEKELGLSRWEVASEKNDAWSAVSAMKVSREFMRRDDQLVRDTFQLFKSYGARVDRVRLMGVDLPYDQWIEYLMTRARESREQIEKVYWETSLDSSLKSIKESALEFVTLRDDRISDGSAFDTRSTLDQISEILGVLNKLEKERISQSLTNAAAYKVYADRFDYELLRLQQIRDFWGSK